MTVPEKTVTVPQETLDAVHATLKAARDVTVAIERVYGHARSDERRLFVAIAACIEILEEQLIAALDEGWPLGPGGGFT